MARVGPVCKRPSLQQRQRVGAYPTGPHFGASMPPVRLTPTSGAQTLRLAAPAADQSPQFGRQPAHMLVLTVAHPLPMPGQLQVLSQLVQPDIGFAQALAALRRATVSRRDQRIVHSQRDGYHMLGDTMALLARPRRGVRQQPGQQFAQPDVHDHGRCVF